MTQGWPASRVRKGRRASLESQDPRDSKESVESQDTLAPVGMRALQECRATRGFLDPED